MNVAESEIEAKYAMVSAEYRQVFGKQPSLRFDGFAGCEAIVVSDWLWLYREDPGSARWSVRIVLPDDPWFFRFDCFTRRDGYEIEKPSFEEAVIYLFQHETHRRCHVARESRLCHR
jgi:hypothetical protein